MGNPAVKVVFIFFDKKGHNCHPDTKESQKYHPGHKGPG